VVPTKVFIFHYNTQLVWQWQAARPLSNCYDGKAHESIPFVDFS